MFSKVRNQVDDTLQETVKSGPARLPLVWLLAALVTGLACTMLYGFHESSEFVKVMTTGGMLSGCSVAVGGLLGFLFGIPRTMQQDALPASNTEADRKVGYGVNTNLEQISDWLTKILVGVGLTQIASMPGYLQSLASYFGAGLGSPPEAEAFAAAVIVYFTICGFLFSYLWTRLYFADQLEHHKNQAADGPEIPNDGGRVFSPASSGSPSLAKIEAPRTQVRAEEEANTLVDLKRQEELNTNAAVGAPH
jgi:hypothetical protein